MSGDVVYPGEWNRKGAGDNGSGGNHTGGNEPPGGGSLEKRVAELEKANLDIREKLVRVETKLDSVEKSMATKADLSQSFGSLAKSIADVRTELSQETGTINQSVANFRTEITRLEGTLIKWFIVTALALSAGIGSIAFGLARSLK